MRAARAPKFLHDIYTGGIESGRCAEAYGVRELFVGDIHGSDECSQFPGDLYGQVTETADTENRQALAGLYARVSQGAKNSDAGAEERRRVRTGKRVRNFHGVARGSFDELGVAAVNGYARDFLLDAEILIALAAEFTFAARPVQPGNADTIAKIERIDGRTFFDDTTGYFVAEDQRPFGDGHELGPITIGEMQV